MISEKHVLTDEQLARVADFFAPIRAKSRADVLLTSTTPVGESGFPE
ncbi:hypothetical protein JHN55_32145 [Streptomyces sp. MBT56]|nr:MULTISPECIES: hypothetical protein [unclassified Streptomyces]MBK3561099.1 hypothetical protein [Streptomyces sp. MBT56]MBK3615470.1 hypothetical protein [Streptomyces sp. MBT98]